MHFTGKAKRTAFYNGQVITRGTAFVYEAKNKKELPHWFEPDDGAKKTATPAKAKDTEPKTMSEAARIAAEQQALPIADAGATKSEETA